MATASGWSRPKSSNDRPTIIDQIDTLQRISRNAKEELLGNDWFQQVKSFYSLFDSLSPSGLYFRPNVDIPQLQMFMLSETAELTDNTPFIYVTDEGGQRDKQRESQIRGQWRMNFYNLKIMLAQLWANLGGTGILAYGLDPLARGGRGAVWADAIDPSQFDPDPVANDDEDWQYVVYERSMHWDQIIRRWPDRGYYVRRGAVAKGPMTEQTAGMKMPFGPMEGIGVLSSQRRAKQTNLINVRFCYCFDPTPEKVKDAAGSKAAEGMLTASKFRLMFPNGRLTIVADDIVLYDGDNPTPRRRFPFVPYWGMPKLEGFWAPPPIRYTKTLQDFAERGLSQGFENFFRLNNGVWLLPEGSNLNPDTFGGLPGEIQVYNAMQGEPKCVTPNALPTAWLEAIKFSLQIQAELQGYSQARQGQVGQGNVGVELYEAAIEENSKLTKLRSRMSAVSTQKFAEAVFDSMAMLYNHEVSLPVFDPEFGLVPWQPIETGDRESYNVWIDPGSIEIASAKNLRKFALALNAQGKLPDEDMLEIIGIPGAREIAQEAAQQAALKALTQIKEGRTQKRTP